LVLTAMCFGAESPGGVPSVIETIRAEENVVSVSCLFRLTGKFLRSKEFVLSIKPFPAELF
jgi:hypothetical protein